MARIAALGLPGREKERESGPGVSFTKSQTVSFHEDVPDMDAAEPQMRYVAGSGAISTNPNCFELQLDLFYMRNLRRAQTAIPLMFSWLIRRNCSL